MPFLEVRSPERTSYLELTGGNVTIGSSDDADIVIRSPDVRPAHFVLIQDGERFFLAECDSDGSPSAARVLLNWQTYFDLAGWRLTLCQEGPKEIELPADLELEPVPPEAEAEEPEPEEVQPGYASRTLARLEEPEEPEVVPAAPDRTEPVKPIELPVAEPPVYKVIGWDALRGREVSFEKIRQGIDSGVVTGGTYVKGPGTDGQWKQARKVPRISRLVGYCPKCRARVHPDDERCRRCNFDLDSTTAPVEPERKRRRQRLREVLIALAALVLAGVAFFATGLWRKVVPPAQQAAIDQARTEAAHRLHVLWNRIRGPMADPEVHSAFRRLADLVSEERYFEAFDACDALDADYAGTQFGRRVEAMKTYAAERIIASANEHADGLRYEEAVKLLSALAARYPDSRISRQAASARTRVAARWLALADQLAGQERFTEAQMVFARLLDLDLAEDVPVVRSKLSEARRLGAAKDLRERGDEYYANELWQRALGCYESLLHDYGDTPYARKVEYLVRLARSKLGK